jgi:hypothetical protein
MYDEFSAQTTPYVTPFCIGDRDGSPPFCWLAPCNGLAGCWCRQIACFDDAANINKSRLWRSDGLSYLYLAFCVFGVCQLGVLYNARLRADIFEFQNSSH